MSVKDVSAVGKGFISSQIMLYLRILKTANFNIHHIYNIHLLQHLGKYMKLIIDWSCKHKPFPSYRCFLAPLQQTAFWKHSEKRRNCSKWAISPFVTMFSTFSHIGQSINNLTHHKLQKKRFHLHSFRNDPLNTILRISRNLNRGRGSNMLIYANLC